ncbi:MAG: phosphoenolpyruvate synthase [Alphaproteobacteria bacterium]|nr:phosphoenolpyruvate synthase [Alphaproteobacteria bacterium]
MGSRFVRALAEVGEDERARFGGKAVQLAALCGVEGVHVPGGFCVSAEAGWGEEEERPVREEEGAAGEEGVGGEEGAAEEEAGRAALHGLPEAIAAEIRAAVLARGPETAWAVRSSATTEDQAHTAFAGLHDSFLAVVGADAVVDAVRRCRASLHSARAVAWRRAQGILDTDARMAVLVQELVPAEVSGTLFTADPVSGRRGTAAIEACAGLGEALVGGRVAGQGFALRGGVVERRPEPGVAALLTDDELRALEALGRRIEAARGAPQDIEWCRAGGRFSVVQSRPITTLFPIPPAPDDAPRIYLSVAHQQMMLDALTPLGRSLWLKTTPRPMAEAGGRLFVDVTAMLATGPGRAALLHTMAQHDLLTLDALRTVLDRGDLLPPVASSAPAAPPPAAPPPLEADDTVVPALIAAWDDSLEQGRRRLQGCAGEGCFDAIDDDLVALRERMADPVGRQAYMSAIDAAFWLDEQLGEWLGEADAAAVLARSAPGDVTAEMALGLLDVADAIRPHPAVVAWLGQVDAEVGQDALLSGLRRVGGGAGAADALGDWLQRYGMRGVGEIDLGRPRFRERPGRLLPLLLAHVQHLPTGEATRRRDEGAREAADKAADVLGRLQALPQGADKVDRTRRAIARLRTYMGYREYPKFGMIQRYGLYKQVLLGQARRLVQAGVLADETDAFFLSFDELRAVVRTGRVQAGLVAARRLDHARNERLRPPRVLTSEGECLDGGWPDGAARAGELVGLPVSLGVAEGRARVLLDVGDAALQPGEILVTRFTDPSWTPAFLLAGGLVTEIGGRMTHGAVVARELGLPAVVGVHEATTRIRDGQRIRVDGGRGTVALLD